MLKVFDNRRLSDLIYLWHKLHGKTLKDAKYRYSRLLNLSQALGNPIAKKFKLLDFVEYRIKRLEQVKPTTVNHEHRYLSAVFNLLITFKLWHYSNPLDGLKQLKIDDRERGYLTTEQITLLLNELKQGRNKQAYYISKICLATGSRWNEAESLHYEHIRDNKITFNKTKNGRIRAVPIAQSLQDDLITFNGFGSMFGYSRSAYRHAVGRCGLNLPKGQLTHILRHTFASHFMMNGGNILTLQKVLGHQSLSMTMKYAHLSPDYLEEATRLNPLAKMVE